VSEIRLSKFLADCGISSRRGAEELIASGRVSVDKKTIRVQGFKIDPINSKVQVDGETISAKNTKTYIAFHKPRGVLSTMSDPEGRGSLAQYFGSRNERLFHVGRLDKESEGLILLTNDGIWANRIAHPSHGVTKRYIVECDRVIKDEELAQLRKGVKLEDGLARAELIRSSGKNLEISIHDGRKHIIRRMVATQGLKVNRLIRVAIGSIKLGELPAGRFRRLGEDEVVNI